MKRFLFAAVAVIALAAAPQAAKAEQPTALDHQPQALEQIVDASQVVEAFQVAQAYNSNPGAADPSLRQRVMWAFNVGYCSDRKTVSFTTNRLNPLTQQIERVTMAADPTYRECQIVQHIEGSRTGGFTSTGQQN